MNPSPPNWQDPAQISFPLTTTKQSGFLALSQPLKLKEVQMRKSRALLSTCENFDRLAARFGQHFSSLQFLKKNVFLDKPPIYSSSQQLRGWTPGATECRGKVMKWWRSLCFSGGSATQRSLWTREKWFHMWGFQLQRTTLCTPKKNPRTELCLFTPLLSLSLTTFQKERKERKERKSFSFATIIL